MSIIISIGESRVKNAESTWFSCFKTDIAFMDAKIFS